MSKEKEIQLRQEITKAIKKGWVVKNGFQTDVAVDEVFSLFQDKNNIPPCYSDIKKEAARAKEQTKGTQNTKTTERELILGERAFINGALWFKYQINPKL